jgi:hypothetical protein
MPIGSVFRNDLLELVFKATTITGIAQNAGSPLTDLYISLHTSDPTATGNQESSEAAYTDYDRVAVARTGSGWDVVANVASPVANIDFPPSGASGSTVTHFMVGTAASSTGKQLFSGTVTPNIAIGAAGITPRLTTATTITLT